MVAPLRGALALVLVLTGLGLLSLGSPAPSSAASSTLAPSAAPPLPSDDPFYR